MRTAKNLSFVSIYLSIYLSIDVPMVALIIVCPSKSFQKILPKTFPKSSQKTFPNSSPNPPKILPKPSQNPPRTLLRNWTRSKIDFFWFFLIFGGPGASQNRAKILKNRKKSWKNRNQKTTCFLTQFFLDFSQFWPPKTKPKSRFYRYFFENVDFVKIVLPPRRRAYFQGSEPPKTDPKSMPKRTRKKHRKKIS